MGGQESLWRVSGRFLLLVLFVDCLLIAALVGVSSLDGSLSAREFARNTWILCLVVAVLWLLYELGRNGITRVGPGAQWGWPRWDYEMHLRTRPALAAEWEMTLLTIAVVAGLALVAAAVQVAG